MIFPSPAHCRGTEIEFKSCKAVCLYGADAAFAAELFMRNGFAVDENAQTVISLGFSSTRELTYIEQARRISDEKFNIKSELTDDRLNISVTYAHRHGLYYAVNRIIRGLRAEKVLIGEIEDYPLFDKRGYIEGFYGKPWNAQQREQTLELLASYGMNTYYYAPKDDPYHRDKWRELYPAQELENLARLCRLCGENFVDFNYCIAPGLSMKYSSEGEYQALFCKVKQLYSVGVRGFGLLLDDIPERLYYEEDCIRFDYETVNAHIYLANRLYADLKALDANTHLTVCPLVYYGRGDEYYVSRLGKGIEPCVDLFWTGHNICSQELSVPEAILFEQATNHRALYWDNFPVNDAEMQNEMHLGCITGRDEGLYLYSRGLISNTMEYCLSSRIPLLTVADYLWNPTAYNARESWKNALKIVLGANAESFEYFADNLFFSCLKQENSSIFNSAAARAQAEIFAGNTEKAIHIFTDYLQKLHCCCDFLRGEGEILGELSRWISKQLLACEILDGCAAVLCGKGDKSAVEALLNSYLRLPEVLYDFSFECFVREVLTLDGH